MHQLKQSDYSSYQGVITHKDLSFDHVFDSSFHRFGLTVIGQKKLHLEILVEDKIYVAIPELKDTFFTLDKSLAPIDLGMDDYFKVYEYLFHHLEYDNNQFILSVDSIDIDQLSKNISDVSLKEQFLSYGLTMPKGELIFEKNFESFEVDLWMGRSNFKGVYEIAEPIEIPVRAIKDVQPLKEMIEQWVDVLKGMIDYEEE